MTTVIRVSKTETEPAKVIEELRHMADFIADLSNIGAAKVSVTGELNLVVDYRSLAEVSPSERCNHVLVHPNDGSDHCTKQQGHDGPHEWGQA